MTSSSTAVTVVSDLAVMTMALAGVALVGQQRLAVTLLTQRRIPPARVAPLSQLAAAHCLVALLVAPGLLVALVRQETTGLMEPTRAVPAQVVAVARETSLAPLVACMAQVAVAADATGLTVASGLKVSSSSSTLLLEAETQSPETVQRLGQALRRLKVVRQPFSLEQAHLTGLQLVKGRAEAFRSVRDLPTDLRQLEEPGGVFRLLMALLPACLQQTVLADLLRSAMGLP